MDELEPMVRAHTSTLFRFCFHHLRDRHLAEDAVQETFLRAFRSLESSKPDNVSAWLFGVARNCCHELQRKRKPSGPVPDVAAPAANEPDARLEAALDLLDDDEVALLMLKHVDGKRCAEIAEITGRPIGTVTGTLTRVYAKLRATIKP